MCSALCRPCLILFDLSLNSLWFNHFIWQSLAVSSHCWKVQGTCGLKVGISMILWAKPSFNPYLKISVVPRLSRLAWAFPAKHQKVVMNNSRSSPCLSWVSFDQESCLSLVFLKASLKSCLNIPSCPLTTTISPSTALVQRFSAIHCTYTLVPTFFCIVMTRSAHTPAPDVPLSPPFASADDLSVFDLTAILCAQWFLNRSHLASNVVSAQRSPTSNIDWVEFAPPFHSHLIKYATALLPPQLCSMK